ncbi:MAG: protein-L-isoaspartate O-methyltransferase [Candidatus Moranbacteria bacterium RIFCSPHIGHO2_12_FULL_54_9]|nr:MAG: protein-L-isoaspartate O-methyltransferase [Candidatus Moranbacteria bacterium RIFCSPHIGHO2_01_FULL_54_31]OGI24780.1 MAG: protein-L-isoaspartate O-methyltransferase [Candidatus Moranbacteria bacterium RIFCSPHIGHO2_12_FULL_54_9]
MGSGLVELLIRNGYLKSEPIIRAFNEITRADFVPPEFEQQAEADIPLPIGYGQAISQPTTVAIMFELLDPHPGQRILDVGSGSGWTSALLGNIVGSEGKVAAIELLPELHEMTKRNVEKFGLMSSGIVECVIGDGHQGYAPLQPYDRILVSAAADEVPQALKDQLVVGGKIVIPVHNHLTYLEKRGEKDFYKEEFPGFVFVPLVQKSL